LTEEITKLKKKKNAVILAHYYEERAIQEAADYVGGSLGLAIKVSKTNADMIVFASVLFMAEISKHLNPSKKVVLMDMKTYFNFTYSSPPNKFISILESQPGHKVISYINRNAEIKAMSDIICTTSNAVDIVNSFP